MHGNNSVGVLAAYGQEQISPSPLTTMPNVINLKS